MLLTHTTVNPILSQMQRFILNWPCFFTMAKVYELNVRRKEYNSDLSLTWHNWKVGYGKGPF